MYLRALKALRLCVITSWASCAVASSALALNNIWTNETGGLWQLGPNWSLGAAPTNTHSVLITNLPAKTVIIDATTVANAPGSLTINRLLLAGEGGETNGLKLLNPGLITPLQISNTLIISNNAALYLTNAALSITGPFGELDLKDGIVAAEDATILTGALHVGLAGCGEFAATRGGITALSILVGAMEMPGEGGDPPGVGGTGTVTFLDTTVVNRGLFTVGQDADTTGAVSIVSTEVTTTNNATQIGFAGFGALELSNATFRAREVYVGASSDSHGTVLINTGTLAAGSFLQIGWLPNSMGTVSLMAGQLVVTNDTIHVGVAGSGALLVAGGLVRAREIVVAANPGAQGVVNVTGGAVAIRERLTIGRTDCAAAGTVEITTGTLAVTNVLQTGVLEVRGGELIVSGGQLIVDRLVVTNNCGQFVYNGGRLSVGTAVLDPARDDDGDGLPNGWEQMFGLDPLDSAGINGPTGDRDGDGLTNAQELSAGTSPVDPNSALRITGITREGDSVRVSWMTGIGRTNALQSVVSAGFTNQFVDLFAVTNTVGTATNFLDTAGTMVGPTRFYRVRLVP